MKARLYQYAVIWHPSEKQEEDGQKSKLVTDIHTVLVEDEQAATIAGARAIPDEYSNQLDQLEVVVRPF